VKVSTAELMKKTPAWASPSSPKANRLADRPKLPALGSRTTSTTLAISGREQPIARAASAARSASESRAVEVSATMRVSAPPFRSLSRMIWNTRHGART
jgi:hypothetical protein